MPLPRDINSRQLDSYHFVGSITAQRVGIFNSSGVQIDAFGGGESEFVDDADWTALSSKHGLVGGIYQSTPGSITDGDTGPLRVTSNGALHTSLQANSGVDIGDVDITSIIPGTGATNLGKAEDAAHATGDTGVSMLGVYRDDKTGISADTVEDYAVPHIDSKGRMRVSPGGQHLFDSFVSTTGWAALNDDTITLTTSLNHVAATGSLSFDKANGTANTVFAIIDKTITSVSLGNLGTGSLFLQAVANIPTLTNTVNVVIRVGTDDTNYNEWKIPTDDATAGVWEVYRALIGNSTGSTGNGWDLTAITYIAVGVEFSGETNTLAAILFDSLAAVGGQVNSTDAAAEITSQVSSANVNLQKVGGSATDKGSGNLSNGSQRIAIATDDVNTAAMVVDLAAIEVTQDALVVDLAAIEVTQDALVVDLAAIEVTQNTIAGAVAGGQMQVDIVADGADLLTNTNFAAAFGTAGSADAQVMSIQGVASMTPVIVDLGSNNDVTATLDAETTKVIGTVRIASGGVASGSFASGSIASGALASGSIAAGAVAAGATSFVALEDDASANLDAGVKIMARRTASPADTSDTDGDYEMIQMDNGYLHVLDKNSAAILSDTTAILADTAAIQTAVEIIDNAVYVDDADWTDSTSSHALVGGLYQATPQTVTDGDVAPFNISVNGAAHTLEQGGASIGPGHPAVDSYTQFAINLGAAADQVLVASSANKQIWVYGYQFTIQVAGSVSFQDEDNAALSGIMTFAANGGASVAPSGNFAMPIWKLGTDKDLEVDVVTAELDGWLTYAIVSV